MDPISTIIQSLLPLSEAEWVEFKQNNSDPHEVGEYISALSNSAALYGKRHGYIIWGIEDGSSKIVGTSFQPKKQKVGNQDLESWLINHLEPRVNVHIHEIELEGKRLVAFEISPTTTSPVRFKGTEFIRIGSVKKKLHEYPEKERSLWRLFDNTSFEKGLAATSVSADDVYSLIDYSSYFNLMKQPVPKNQADTLKRLASEELVSPLENGKFDITNMGAILFAKNLNDFRSLSRKALRVIVYPENDRVKTIKEHVLTRGYAAGFDEMTSYINDQLPQSEHIGEAFRQQVRVYPEVAVRELVANALIHQDFTISGTGPMVEIFANRIEITNPGVPLIDTARFIDEPPFSRNEDLAAFLRRVSICEERGSGIDKVIRNIELFQLPPPDFRVTERHTTAIIFGPQDISRMDREERLRACYQHACLLHVEGQKMSNASLRKRLNIKEANYPMASRIIRDAVAANQIKAAGLTGLSRNEMAYIPFWA